MKIDLADSSKQPSLKELNCISIEFAEEVLTTKSLQKDINIQGLSVKKKMFTYLVNAKGL